MLRTIRRNVAKEKMRYIGMVKFCKSYGNRRDGKSYFSLHWREFA